MTALVTLPQTSVLASLPDDPGIFETLAYQVNGLIVVFCALGSIWLLLELIGALFRRAERLRQSAATAVPSGEEPAGEDTPMEAVGLEPAVLAAIVAAVAVATDATARIVSVTPVDADWAREGRRQIFSSHNVR